MNFLDSTFVNISLFSKYALFLGMFFVGSVVLRFPGKTEWLTKIGLNLTHKQSQLLVRCLIALCLLLVKYLEVS